MQIFPTMNHPYLRPYRSHNQLIAYNKYQFQGFIDQDDETSKSLSPTGIGHGGDLGVNSVTGSLEDLVATFDEKLQQCFKDYQEEAEKIAPVQVKLKKKNFLKHPIVR